MYPPFEFKLRPHELKTLNVFPAYFMLAVVPVLSNKSDGSFMALGSAFCLTSFANGIALFATARHVVDIAEKNPQAKLYIAYPRGVSDMASVNDIQGLCITHVFAAGSHSDVAVLSTKIDLSYPEPGVIGLRLSSPTAGEDCVALGYSDMELHKSLDINKSGWAYKLHASRGKVEEIYPQMRDKSFVNYPSFLTDAKYKEGMSGGPVLDMKGNVMGIVSTSYDHGEGSPLQTSYVSLSADLIEIQVTIPFSDGTTRQHKISDLVPTVIPTDSSNAQLSRTIDSVSVSW